MYILSSQNLWWEKSMEISGGDGGGANRRMNDSFRLFLLQGIVVVRLGLDSATYV